MIFDLLNLLKGWDYLLLTGSIPIQKDKTKYINIPNIGFITSALFTTTSPYTSFAVLNYNTTPNELAELNMYRTKPIGLYNLNPPYTIIVNPNYPIIYKENSRLQVIQSIENAEVTYVIRGVQITNKKDFLNSIREVLSNEKLHDIILNFLQSIGD